MFGLPRRGILALMLIVMAAGAVIQGPGAGQMAHYALVRSLAEGRVSIDPYAGQTVDISFREGHFYANKAPGVATFALPAYLLLDRSGLADRARERAEALSTLGTGSAPPPPGTPAAAVRTERGVVWAVGLWALLVPAFALLVLVARLGEAFAPGTGVATAVLLGLGTMVLPFSTLLASHLIAGLIGLATFALLHRARARPPSAMFVGGAGSLAGIGVAFEYPQALVGFALGLYAVVGVAAPIRRGLLYAGGVIVGIAPLLVYQAAAFGSPLRPSYADQAPVTTGGAPLPNRLGDAGFLGLPDLGEVVKLLLAPRGLLVLAPVLVLAVPGLVRLARSGRRPEALLIGLLVGAYVLYLSGFFDPSGSDAPGPRLLVAVLPFIALAVAAGLRVRPGVAVALGGASVAVALLSTLTLPNLPGQDVGRWAVLAREGVFQETVLGIAGIEGGLAVVAVLVPAVGALVLTALVTPGRALSAREALLGAGALMLWAAVGLISAALSEGTTPERIAPVLALGAAAGVLALLIAGPARTRTAST
jgi:hypothetical protein